MSLKAIYESSNPDREQLCSLKKLIEVQSETISNLQKQMHELSAANLMLRNELEQKSYKVQQMQERLAKLSESDLVLQRNHELEEQLQMALEQLSKQLQIN